MQIFLAVVTAVAFFHKLLRNLGFNIKVDYKVGFRNPELFVFKIVQPINKAVPLLFREFGHLINYI